MAHYVVLGQFTDQGIRGVKDTTKRAKNFRETAKSMNVTVKDIYWTLGLYDVIVTIETPDDETATSFMMKIGSLGNLKSQTLRAFSESEAASLVAKL